MADRVRPASERRLGLRVCENGVDGRSRLATHTAFGVGAGTHQLLSLHGEGLRSSGLSDEIHQYQVNGRTPLEWFIDRYRITQDKESGIVNDPNAWFDDPRELIAVIRRIVHVSVESTRIVEGLPEPILEPKHL